MTKNTVAVSCLVPVFLLLLLLFLPDEVLISFLRIHRENRLETYAEYKLVRSVLFIFFALVGLIASLLAARNKTLGAHPILQNNGGIYACILLMEIVSIALFEFIDHV
jgi:hypothetical protein